MSNNWQQIRQQVLVRDNFTYRVCGRNDLNRLEVHHNIPRRLGGDNSFDNLITTCASCHDHVLNNISFEAVWFVRHSNANPERKIIKLKDETHAKLMSIGKYRETMDDIVRKGIEAYERLHRK